MSTTPQDASRTNSTQGDSSRKKPVSLEFRADGRPRFEGCSKISAYEVLSKLGEGTFGEVHKARSIKSGSFVALKKILMHNEKDGFPITALREIKLLKMLSHPNILKLEEMAVEYRKKDKGVKAVMYMVTPYMDHDLSGLLENPAVRITEPQIKCYMLQLLEGLRYLHAEKILHRDMKAANLLINNKGILQIADFGLARPYDDPPPLAGRGGGEATRDYTTLVVTRWYRPPELLLQLRKYTTAIDLWGVGCVFGEMFKGRPILAGKSDMHQLTSIFDLVGSPNDETMPGWNFLPGAEGLELKNPENRSKLNILFREQGSGMISLITELLRLDWRKRINAMDALQHPYFKNPPLPLLPGEIPQFEESHELDRRKFRDQQSALPPAPAGGTVGVGPHAADWGGANGNNNNNNRRQGNGPPTHHSNNQRNSYDNRSSRNSGPANGRNDDRRNDRRPAWRDGSREPPQHRERNSTLPPPPHGGLPPRPATTANWTGWAGDSAPDSSGSRGPDSRRDNRGSDHNDSRPRGGGRLPPTHAGGGKDTYIPSYKDDSAGRGGRGPRERGGGGDGRDERGRDDRGGGDGWDDDRRSNFSNGSRRRSRSPPRKASRERVREGSKEVYGRR